VYCACVQATGKPSTDDELSRTVRSTNSTDHNGIDIFRYCVLIIPRKLHERGRLQNRVNALETNLALAGTWRVSYPVRTTLLRPAPALHAFHKSSAPGLDATGMYLQVVVPSEPSVFGTDWP
jgi:hypothetical protein